VRLPLRPILAAALAAAALGGWTPARAAGVLDLSAVKARVDEGVAAGGPAKQVRAYRTLQKGLALESRGLPDDLARLRAVASACAGKLVTDGPLRTAMQDGLDAAANAIRTLDAVVIGKAGDLALQGHRDGVLAGAARALALERSGESKRIFGADAAAAGLFRRAALGLASAGRLADRLLARETPKNPVWAVPVQGRGGALLGVWGEPGPDPRLFVVGAADADGPQFLVRHPGADGWVRVPVAATGDLWWVTVVPGDGAWASGTGGRVVRYDASTGELADRSTGVDATLYGIWGSGPTDIWTVGGDPAGFGPVPAIEHWDGAAWSPVAPPPEADGRMIYKVWGTASDDVWAVGEQGIILHYDGAQWSAVPSPTASTLLTVAGPSPVTAVGGGVSGVAVERGGNGHWTSISVTGVNGGSGGQTGGGPVKALNGVFVPSTGAGLAVGFSGTVVSRGLTGWTGVLGVPAAVKDLHAVWIDGAGNAVMVGGKLSNLTEGHVVTYGRTSLPSTVALRARFRDGVADMIYLGCAHSGCHLPPFSNAGLALDTPEVTLANLVGVGSTQSPLLRVFPGRPSQSYLWHKMLGTQGTVGGSGERMPVLHLPGDAYFTDGQMELLRGWILDGARDN
jgi:hypothetical protein